MIRLENKQKMYLINLVKDENMILETSFVSKDIIGHLVVSKV